LTEQWRICNTDLLIIVDENANASFEKCSRNV